MTMKERRSYIKEVITVEPIIICHLTPTLICAPALNALKLEKACRANERFNKTVCDAIVTGTYKELNFTAEANAVQQRIVKMQSWQEPLQSFMPVLLVLFVGSYSDRHKIRKPFLLIPQLGELLGVAGCLLCILFMEQWPLEILGFMQTVLPSILGSSTMLRMAAFSYVTCVSTLKMRTLRIGIILIIQNYWNPIVQSFSGILYSKIGYVAILLVAAVMYLIGLLYGIFCIREPEQSIDVHNKKNLIKDIFDPRHAIQTFKLLTEGKQRLDIVVIIFILLILNGVVTEEESVFFLFGVKVYQWTSVEFSYFTTTDTVIHVVGNIVALPLCTKVLNLDDLIITVISFLDKIVGNIIYIIFVSPIGLYAGCALGIISIMASITIRSQSTKIVSEDDLAKAQSLFAIAEVVAPAILIPIYNQGIYSATLDSFPQAFLFLGIALYGIRINVVMWLYFRNKKRASFSKKKDVESNGMETEYGKTASVVETTHI